MSLLIPLIKQTSTLKFTWYRAWHGGGGERRSLGEEKEEFGMGGKGMSLGWEEGGGVWVGRKRRSVGGEEEEGSG